MPQGTPKVETKSIVASSRARTGPVPEIDVCPEDGLYDTLWVHCVTSFDRHSHKAIAKCILSMSNYEYTDTKRIRAEDTPAAPATWV